MSLSKLSDKCQKCKRKDTCDNKRMESCAYIIPRLDGAFPIDNKSLFIEREGQPELIGRLSNKPRMVDNEQIIASIREAVKKGMVSALKGLVM